MAFCKNFLLRGSKEKISFESFCPGYIESKKGQLKDAGISEDSYHIFYPDFITANFEAIEVFRAFMSYFHEIKNKIESRSERKIELIESDKQELVKRLIKKKEIEKYENIIEKFLKEKVDINMKKVDFANHLLNIMRNNLSNSKRNKKYLFEEILGKFIDKISKKRYPI